MQAGRKHLVPFLLALAIGAGAATPPDIGAFLALRQAKFNNDDMAIGRYVDRGLEANPDDLRLIEEAVISALYRRDLPQAMRYVELLPEDSDKGLPAALAMFGDAVQRENFAASVSIAESEASLGFLHLPILRAWQAALSEDSPAAINMLEEAARADPELKPLFDYQKAMIIASIEKDYASAADIIANDGSPLYFSDMSFFNEMALRTLAGQETFAPIAREFGEDEALWPLPLRQMLASAQSGQIDPSLGFHSPKNAIVEYLDFMFQQSDDNRIKFQIERVFQFLMAAMVPESGWQQIKLLDFFTRAREFDDVVAISDQFPSGDSFAPRAARYRIDALFGLEKDAEAETALRALEANSNDALAYKAQAFQRLGLYNEAISYFERYIESVGEANVLWYHLYSYADALARTDNWPQARDILYKLKEDNPTNADILNYLGYTLVDRGEQLEEGLDLVREAVNLAPNEGYIVDSLGWAYYKAGRYEDAVVELEYAVTLMSTDPTVNSHLGDAYWKAGREREAVFQWKRALLFVDEPNSEVTREELENKVKNGL